MYNHTVCKVGVYGDMILIDLNANARNFGICRLADNRRDGFMREYFH